MGQSNLKDTVANRTLPSLHVKGQNWNYAYSPFKRAIRGGSDKESPFFPRDRLS